MGNSVSPQVMLRPHRAKQSPFLQASCFFTHWETVFKTHCLTEALLLEIISIRMEHTIVAWKIQITLTRKNSLISSQNDELQIRGLGHILLLLNFMVSKEIRRRSTLIQTFTWSSGREMYMKWGRRKIHWLNNFHWEPSLHLVGIRHWGSKLVKRGCIMDVVKTTDSEVKLPGWGVLAVWPWVSYLTSVYLSF